MIAFSSASQLAQHVLRTGGPQTIQTLYKACTAIDAPAPKRYKQPGHRDFRIITDRITGKRRVINGTVEPPNPEHLVRSVKFLKSTLRSLEAYEDIGHAHITDWLAAARAAKAESLAKQAEELQKEIKEKKDSEFIWVDGEVFYPTVRKSGLPQFKRRKSKQAEKKLDALS